jgi:hypothetical protein
MTAPKHGEGLKFARLLMVMSSLSPLLILWAVRGVEKIPDVWVWLVCAVLIIVPNLFLFARIQICKKNEDTKVLTIGKAEDHREYLLVYLFATLLPFYDKLDSNRNIAATLVALLFIVYLFFHLNLHYMNIFFALFGYRVFTIEPPPPKDGVGGEIPFVLLTKRTHLKANEKITAFRLSDNVFFE